MPEKERFDYFNEHLDLFLFLGTIFLTIIVSTFVYNDYWTPLDIHAVSLFSVEAVSENVLFAAGVDSLRGSMIYHSKDRGQTWEALKSLGNNLDLAVSKDHKKICAVGNKAYCLTLKSEEEVDIEELPFRTNSRDISSIGDHGFAVVGMFAVPGIQTQGGVPINGVAINTNVRSPNDWRYYDIGLDIASGYFASHGAFPSETTWYVTSSAWPVQTHSKVATILSGRLNLIPVENKKKVVSNNEKEGGEGKGEEEADKVKQEEKEIPQHHVNYEFLNLKNVGENLYAGGISKTTDGGHTWTQVFDSERKFYLNQIHCIDEMSCVTVGEGSKSTVVLLTNDGGSTWETVLNLNGDYSLHACQMISKTEIWVAGGMIVKDNLRRRSVGEDMTDQTYVGLYYRSMNGGKTWSLKTAEGYAYDISFYGEEVGYAAVLFRESASIERFL
eukprot:gene11786-12859_t